MSTVLGFDTATGATAVAVLAPGREPVERRHDPAPGERPGHARRLLALVEEVLEEAGVPWEQVERIAVGTGPGTFTGLRIGIATARALGQARGIPLVGVSTLQTLAAAATAAAVAARPVLAVLDARRGEAFSAAWEGARELLPAAAVAPSELAERAATLGAGTAAVLAVGEGAVKFRAPLEQTGAAVPPDDSPLHRVSAGRLCRLAAGARTSEPDTVLPDYLRLADAEIALRRKLS